MKTSLNRIELQKKIKLVMEERNSEVEELVYRWLIDSRTSEMCKVTPRGYAIDTTKAIKHFQLISLYDVLLFETWKYEPRFYKNDPAQIFINKRTRANWLIEAKEFEEKELARKKQVEGLATYIEKVKIDLAIHNSNDELLSDFHGSGSIIKPRLQQNFRMYGINLDEQVLDLFFEKVNLVSNRTQIDFIALLTEGTSFCGGIASQFRISTNHRAQGIFSAFFMRSAGLFDGRTNELQEEQSFDSLSLNANPFISEKQAITLLAKLYLCCYQIKHKN